jgi:hypothetical protein
MATRTGRTARWTIGHRQSSRTYSWPGPSPSPSSVRQSRLPDKGSLPPGKSRSPFAGARLQLQRHDSLIEMLKHRDGGGVRGALSRLLVGAAPGPVRKDRKLEARKHSVGTSTTRVSGGHL